MRPVHPREVQCNLPSGSDLAGKGLRQFQLVEGGRHVLTARAVDSFPSVGLKVKYLTLVIRTFASCVTEEL